MTINDDYDEVHASTGVNSENHSKTCEHDKSHKYKPQEKHNIHCERYKEITKHIPANKDRKSFVHTRQACDFSITTQLFRRSLEIISKNNF